MLPHAPSLVRLAEIIQLAVAPVFLLAGLGAFLNVCAGRLARIVDRTRTLEPRLLASRGSEHDRLLGELRLLDRRIAIVNNAISATVLGAVLTSAMVVLLFLGFLTPWRFSTAIAILFIGAMVCTGVGFAIFLHETRIGTRAVRVRDQLLVHTADDEGARDPG